MDISVLQKDLADLSIGLTDRQEEQFSQYGDLLISWNERMNLTRIVESTAVCRQHFLDSIMPVRYLSLSGKFLIDIGTGAGFPGIPLKIMVPDLKITLLDALDKRCRFLQEVVDQLELTGVTIIHGRAEEIARQEDYRQQFDFATSRAVARLSILSEYAIPFLRTNGTFLAYKLDDSKSELSESENAFRILGAECTKSESYQLPGVEPERTLYFIDKKSPTPDKYPRRAGLPSKKPL